MGILQNLYYNDRGTGTALLLVHGFCLDHHIWDDQVASLRQKYRVIRIDLPGFGKSPSLAMPQFELEDIARQIQGFIVALGLEKVVFVGHSLGGYVGLALAREFPGILKGLALINSSALADSEEKKASRERVNQFVGKHGVPPYIRQFVPELFYDRDAPRLQEAIQKVIDQAELSTSSSLIRTNQAMSRRPSYEEVLKSTEVPVLYLIGRDDPIIPFDLYQEQVHWAPKVSVHIFNQTGHMASLERPQVSSLLLDTFARRCEWSD